MRQTYQLLKLYTWPAIYLLFTQQLYSQQFSAQFTQQQLSCTFTLIKLSFDALG